MENGTSVEKYPVFCYWDVDKYKSKYPPEHWNLCRLFMVTNKTKYPETRLVQLTEAFYNMGVLSQRSDPKTDRLVAALSVPVFDHFLYSHPGAVSHPFQQQALEDAIDSGREVKPEHSTEEENSRPQDHLGRVSPADNSTLQDHLGRVSPADNSTLQDHLGRVIPADNSTLQDHLGRVSPTEQKEKSLIQPLNSLENRQYSLEGIAGSSGSQPHSSKDETTPTVVEQHSTKQEQKFSAHKQDFTELKVGSDKKRVSGDQKSRVSESKRRRLTPVNERSPDSNVSAMSDDHYRLKKLIDRDKMKRLLMGFVIIRDVTKDSTLNNDVLAVEDSFKRSKFGPCSWHINIIDKSKDIKRIKLQFGDIVLVEAEGQNKEFVQLKVAQAFLTRMTSFSPLIKGAYRYYNNGNCRELPLESPKGPCWLYLNHYSYDCLKGIIDGFAEKKEFLEMIVLHHPESPDEFCMEDIIEFIEKERSDKLRYRLADFSYQGKSHRAICIFYIHDGLELLEWLDKHEDQRYCVVFNKTFKTEFWRSAHRKVQNATSVNENERKKRCRRKRRKSTNRNTGALSDHSHSSIKNPSLDIESGPTDSLQDSVSNKTGSSQSQSPSNHEGTQVENSASKGVRCSQGDKSAGNSRYVDQSVTRTSTVEPPKSKQPHVLAPTSISDGRKEKNDELLWVGKEHLPVLAKSIYLVKFVKEDSTTENNPFNLLKSVCSLAFNIDFKYVMKCEEHYKQLKSKRWHVSVVMTYDNGNILLGEARAVDCAEARLNAAQDAVSTIQTYCRVVEPNFNYFAEGGVPRFISLKHPIKTSTYEIMIMDTIKNPLSQPVVNLMLEMFVEDKTIEDLFFLASDYSSEERELICKTAEQYRLGWRLFGQRSRAATADDIVSTQHVCVFRPKSVVELVQQLIVSGGYTDKYSIVTRHNATSLQVDESPVEAETPVHSEPRESCDNERFPGGCFDPKCSLAHVNILDSVVNQFFGIR